ncbi:zinc-binding alcohol dehydrogenase family protein [Dysgonomonas sp. Marseille-P4677]|uniref:quinone oxidoreductase family protein n=1 Tax=Dysgonomonas sp. Marseille-P4677 TaxID=2364790 RepID=UPI0019136E24|nr:zinc-binding alcohol dehydrogenase family protein [Dysgonomonas sp. Marseille-P4677]MBK5722831.1 zinc-binding alcohol dehydrogenase family protein [Dysgonomonas sp. Marseille-P4677]
MIGKIPYDLNLNFTTKKDVLIEIKAFSCNYRDRSFLLEYYQKCEEFNKRNIGVIAPFGSEFVAVVKKVASGVKTLKVGDRVIPNCDYIAFSQEQRVGVPTNCASQRMHIFHENKLIRVPDSMSDEIAASFSVASQTAYSMIRKAEISKNDKVLVTAPTSNTSLAVIKKLRSEGIDVYATSSNTNNKKFLLDQGVQHFIPLEDLEQNSYKEPSFDIVIDPYYDLYLHEIINCMNSNSKYIFCGLCEQYSLSDESDLLFKTNYKIIFTTCIVKNISLIGNCLGHTMDLQNAIEDYLSGKYDITIDSVFSGSDILPFLEKSFNDQSRKGKVVYKYSD